MKEILYVATVVKTHIMEFHIPFLKMLKENGWKTSVAARNDYEDPQDCHIPYCDIFFDVPFERNPFNSKNVTAYKQLKEIIDTSKYNIVHCHTPVGGMLTRLATFNARKKGIKVIYTAHGFHFYKGAPLINWLLYYPVERFLSRYTDVLITINKEDYAHAQKFKAKKICYVPGVGIDLTRFYPDTSKRIETRKVFGFSDTDFVLLSVGELIKRKNHTVVLDALAQLKNENNSLYKKTYYIICGKGPLENELQQKAEYLDLKNHVRFLGYRQDTPEIYNAADTFVFMSLQEGLPVALLEAMACRLPVICSQIRGNIDLIQNDWNGIFAKNNKIDISEKLHLLHEEKDMRNKLSYNAEQEAKKYDIHEIKEALYGIYHETIKSQGTRN